MSYRYKWSMIVNCDHIVFTIAYSMALQTIYEIGH